MRLAFVLADVCMAGRSEVRGDVDAEERLARLYAAEVEMYLVRGTFRLPFGVEWCHVRGEVDRSALLSICDDAGRLLFQLVGLQAGKMKVRRERRAGCLAMLMGSNLK